MTRPTACRQKTQYCMTPLGDGMFIGFRFRILSHPFLGRVWSVPQVGGLR